MNSFFDISNGDVHPYEQFVPFMSSSLSSISGVFALGWVLQIQHDIKDVFVSKMRSYGRDYAQFNITMRNQQGEIVPTTRNDQYYPMCFITPFSSNTAILGYDISTEPVRRVALLQAIATGKISSSSRIYLSHTRYDQPAIIHVLPLFNESSSMFRGASVGIFIIGDLITNTTSALREQSSISIFDRGIVRDMTDDVSPHLLTTDHWRKNNYTSSTFLWSNTGEYGPDFGSVNHINAMIDASSRSPFHYQYPLIVGDRQWDVIFIPKDTYILGYQTGDKWIVLICSILIAVFTSLMIWCANCFLFMRWRALRRMHAFEVGEATKSADHYRKLLNHIGKIDEAKKHILNIIPDMIIVVNKDRKVIYTNAVFDSVFGYTTSEMRNGVYIHDIFPTADIDLQDIINQSNFRESHIKPRLKNEIPVSYCYLQLDIDEKSFTHDSMADILDESKDHDTQSTDKTYVFVIRDMRSNGALISEIQGNKNTVEILLRNSEFERRWTSDTTGVDGFRRNLLRFCQTDKSDENVLFLQDIDRYKMIPNLDARISEQNRILRRYLSDDSDKQLNLHKESIDDVRESCRVNLGDVHAFDNIVEVVKISMTTDIYPRYRLDESRK